MLDGCFLRDVKPKHLCEGIGTSDALLCLEPSLPRAAARHHSCKRIVTAQPIRQVRGLQHFGNHGR